MRRYVTYTRVSTQEQGRSGLGLEAQQRDIELFLTHYSDIPYEILGAFTDIGSGADNGRPEFKKAVAAAKLTGAELLVAKLDRISRKVATIAALMDDPRLQLRVASMPHADKFQLHIYAALAEQERDFISKRTKAAMAVAKTRGQVFGGNRGKLHRARAASTRKADARNAQVSTLIRALRNDGKTLPAVAEELQRLGIPRPRGGSWSPTAVQRIIWSKPYKAALEAAE